MTSGPPTPDINSDAADTLFSRMGAASHQPEDTTMQSSEMGHEQSDKQRVPKQTESMMQRTVATLKKLFGIGAPQRRSHHRRLLAGVQSLEARMVMTGDTDMLTPADISWSEGRNDAAHVLGQANILPGANLYDVSLSPDGSKAIVVGQFAKASIVDAKTGAVITPLQGHESSVISAAWMPDGSSFFTASYDRSVRQYATDGSLLWDSGSIGQLAVGVDVSPDGNTLFVRRHEIEPIAFDLTTKSARILNGALHLADLDAMANGKVLALENDWAQYKGPDNKVHVINPDTGVTEWTGSLIGMQPTTAVATPNGAYVFSGTEGGSIVMHDRALGTSVVVAGLGSDVRDLAMDETGTFLIAATNSSLNVFDMEPLFAGTGSAVHTSFAMGSSSITVSGSVALINNTSLGANSRTLAIDLSHVPNMQARLDALTPTITPQQETVTESHTIDFSTLAQGVKPEMWTTTIESLGQVTMWFQGGTIVDSQGISAVQQPLDGTGFWFRFDNSSVKLLSVELEKEAATQGFLRIVKDNDYIRENGTIKNFDFAPTINFQGDLVDRIDGGQNSGRVTLKSITVEVTVTRDVQVTDADTTEETLATTIDSLEAPWSLDGQTNRIAALTERALALQQAAKDLTSIADTLDEDTAEQMANALLVLIENYVTAENQVFAEGLASLSSAGQLQLQQGMEELRLIVSEIDLSSATRSHSDASRVIDTFQIPELGGAISVHGLQGSSISALQQAVHTVEGTGVITETGRALALDFGSLTSPVLRANFTVTSSEPTDQLRVSFLSDSGVLQEQLVTSGDVVSYENLTGITGIMIENVTDVLSENAKTYLEYLRTYQSNYMYSWQDPGPRHHFFVTVRPDLASQETAIVAEALRGEVSHAVSVKDLSVTTNLAEIRDTSALSKETNGLYAEMALPKIVTFPFPYGGFGGITKVDYDPSSYNVYSLKVFSGAPEIEGMSYVDASGQNRALPSEYFEIHGNSITVFPTGQNLTIGIRVKNGTGYSPSLPVGQNYDYEVLSQSAPSIADALPSPEARISFDAISLMTMNQGPSAGWHSGASLQYDTGSPVAVGTLKAQAQITNSGGSSAGFTVKVYSGNAGTNGWDTLQYSYTGTLAGGESRALVTQFTPMVDSEGRSFVRFVVVGDDGRILMEGGKTVGAAGGVMTAEGHRAKFLDFMKNWTSAMQQAQSETVAYFVSRGETAPTMGNAAAMAEQIVATNTDTSQMPDPAMTERLLRIAMRSLVSAQESGDPDRLAMEQTRFADAVSAHNAARSVAMATPNGGVVLSVGDVLENEQLASALHGAALAKANGGLMEQAYKILVAGTNVDPNFVGPQIPSSGSKQLTLTNGGNRTVPETLVMLPQSTIERTIEINQKTMANFWVDATSLTSVNGMIFQRNFSLSISGDNLDETYTSDRANTSGESISLVLQPGQYTITVQDHTNYGSTPPQTTFSPSLGMDVQRFNGAEIVGRVSIESRNMTMPVRMRVAKFAGNERITDYTQVPELKTDKPVWVVIHGRTDSEQSGKMEDLTKALTEYAAHAANGMQVVTFDWSEAAKNFSSLNPNAWDISDSRWVQAAGEWLGDTLLKLGFSPEQISGTFHSHGNGVGFHMANFLKQKTGQNIHLFMALDPAKNPGLAGGSTAYNDLNISSVSNQSVAFDSSWLGSSHFSGTANRSFLLQTETNDVDPSNGVIDKYIFRDEDILKHGAGLGTVASMIRSLINQQPTPFDPADLSNILNGTGDIGVKANTLAGDEQPIGSKVYEGQIVIRTDLQLDSANNKWLKGSPISFQYMDSVTGLAERRSISGLMLEDHDGKHLNVGEQDQSWLGDINASNDYVFESTSDRETVFQFTLPKPGTMFRLTVEREDGNGWPEEFIIDNEHRSVSLLTLMGNYKITLSQIASSQHYVIGGSPTDADIPYTLSIF